MDKKALSKFVTKHKNIILILLGLFAVAFLLRVLYLPNLALTFSYDQARDAFIAQQILDGDLKIQGPPVSTRNFFHGVFYYYYLAPAYLIGKGSPIVAAYWNSFFNALALFIAFYFAYSLSKKISTGVVAAILFMVSFEATQYATWLSNPTIAVITVPFIYLGLWKWLKEAKTWGIYASAIGLGLSIQAEAFLAYHGAVVAFWVIASWKRVNIKQLVQYAIAFIASVATMIIAQVKFGTDELSFISGLLNRTDPHASGDTLIDLVNIYFRHMGTVFSNSTFPQLVPYGAFIFALVVIWALYSFYKEKNRKLLSWQLFMLSYTVTLALIVPLGGRTTPHIGAGLVVGVVVLLAMLIGELFEKRKVLAVVIVAVLVVSNLIMVLKENNNGQTVFAIQKDLLLRNELKVLDYIYTQSEGSEFGVNSITNPFWINTSWSYLFNWYGVDKYGYLPYWTGRNQVGRLGDNLVRPPVGTTLSFLIIEPIHGMVGEQFVHEINSEDTRTEILDEANYGDLVVQKRKVINENWID